ncbi:MAG: microcin ABC transporter permease, partial [Pseudomonadota bacterium]
MIGYIAKRLALIVPTLIGIMVLNFLIIQTAPGGPVERLLMDLSGSGSEVDARLGGNFSAEENNPGADPTLPYRGAERLRPEFVKEVERMFGFDKPLGERFLQTMGQLLTFDFGKSFFRDQPVTDLVLERLPVSISLGLWSTLLIYLIAVPLGVARAVRRGTRFDLWSGIVVLVCHAIP